MAVKLVESMSVEIKDEQVILSAQNIDPEGLGVLGGKMGVKEVTEAYHQNVDALNRVEKAIVHLKNFCAYRARGFKARAQGNIQDALEWENWAEKEYNQLPRELKW
jgi:hypothetical protein